MKTLVSRVARCSDACQRAGVLDEAGFGDRAAKTHSACPGVRLRRLGKVFACECSCHVGELLYQRKYMPLPLVARRQDHIDQLVAGRCECGCGTPTAKPVAPHHIHGLRLRLYDELESGVFNAGIEIAYRGWDLASGKRRTVVLPGESRRNARFDFQWSAQPAHFHDQIVMAMAVPNEVRGMVLTRVLDRIACDGNRNT